MLVLPKQILVTFKSSEVFFFSSFSDATIYSSELPYETICRLSLLSGSSEKDLISSNRSNAAESMGFATLLCCKQLIQQPKCFFNSCQLLTVTWSHYCNQTSLGHVSHAATTQPSSFPFVIVIVGVAGFVTTFLHNVDSCATQKLLH